MRKKCNWQEDPDFPKTPNQYGTYNSVREIIKKPRKKRIQSK